MPLMIKFIIQWLSDPDPQMWIGPVLAAAISIAYVLKTNMYRKGFQMAFDNMYNYGVVLRALVFNKLSRLSREGVALQNLGNLTNTMNHDVYKIQMMVRLTNMMSQLPFMIIAGTIYFIIYFGWMAVLFPAFFLISIAFIVICVYLLFKYQKKMIVYTEKRSKLISECLSGIKNIKFESWEDISKERLQDYRKTESKYLFIYLGIRVGLNAFSELFTPLFLLMFVSIYTILYGDMPIDQAYLLISISNMVTMPLKASVTFLDSYASVKLALSRISNLLDNTGEQRAGARRQLACRQHKAAGVDRWLAEQGHAAIFQAERRI